MTIRRLYLTPLLVSLLVLSCDASGDRASSADTPAPAPQAVGQPAQVSHIDPAQTTPDENGWYHNYDAAMAVAREQERPIIIDFYTDWCHWCVEMDEKTFSDPSIKQKFADGWIMLKVNAENGEATGTYNGKTLTYRELAAAYGVTGYPAYAFLDKEGTPVTIITGYRQVPQFTMILDYFAEEIYKLDDDAQQQYLESYTPGG